MRQLRSLLRKYYVRQVIACWMMCFMLLGMTPVRIAKANLPPGQLPAGWEVVTGSVGGFDYSTTNELHIRNIANGTIIKWNGGFNIGSAAWAEFQLINSGASVLNRDVTGNMSQIYGRLTSNGQVWIVNPAGVLFGKGATINVNGLVASALNITNENFLNGQHEFAGGNGSVINQGNISAQNVYLVGKQVINAGKIQCPDGYVVMAAADKVYLGQPGGNIIVEIGSLVPPNTEQTQLSSQITNQGTVDAGSGTIILAAAGDALSRPIISNLGSLSTSVAQGDAGNISLQANNGQISNAGEITAISDTGTGGTVTANADEVINSGTVDVSGAKGGKAAFEGTSRLGQFGNIHADGFESDGGSVTLTAEEVVALDSDSLTTANAGTNGDGGEVTIYSPDTALFYEGAKIEAKGGSQAGDGGFVEVSGKEHVEIFGSVDTSTLNGDVGTFLIDPYDITIVSSLPTQYGSWSGGDPDIWNSTDDSGSRLNISTLLDNLDDTDVIVQTGGGSSAYDNIIVDTPINYSPSFYHDLTLSAEDHIVINYPITTGTHDLTLIANNSGNLLGDISFYAPITLSTGNLQASGVNINSNSSGTITALAGNVTLNAERNITTNAAINLNMGRLEMYGGLGVGPSSIQINEDVTAGSIKLECSGDITTEELTAIINNIYVHSTGGDLIVNGDITATPILEIDMPPGGGVSLIADEGKIYTEGGSNDTLNVSITGYSDDNQNVGVDLPKHYGNNANKGELDVGKAAIVIMSEETLKLGSGAELTANGVYDSEGIVDDRPGVDFLNVPEGSKNPGEPIDVAIYLASNAGNVEVDSPVAIAPFGVMAVDAYDTVESFGVDFINSLGGIHWLEVCSRITSDLGFARTNGTIPYADDAGLFPGSGQYVLRGENPDVGTGAWELEEPPAEETDGGPTLPLQEIVEVSNVDPPVTPELEDRGQGIRDRGFDDMQWMANELGLCDGDQQGEDENLCQEITQAYLAGAFLQATDLRPYRAATRLRDLVEILHDDDGTRIAGLVRAVNEFSQPDMPPSPEQFASIAQSFADHSNDGTHYAAAGEWLDALMEYVAILTSDVGWSEDESIAFVMGKYGTSITEAGDVSVTAFVQMRLEGFGV